MTDISDDAKRNRTGWTKANTEFTDEHASRAWRAEAITWGVFAAPEASLDTLGDATDHPYYVAFSVDWSRKWPSKEIWVAEKRS